MKFLVLLTLLMSSAFAANPVVVMETNVGSVEIELDEVKAPVSVKNFLSYVDAGFYSDTIFHRVINGFMIQGGGFTKDMKEKKTNAPIQNEASNGLKNLKGTVAMARTQDLHSATSQFFINVNDNEALDHRGTSPDAFGYAVFGKVINGMHVVDRIKMMKTGTIYPHSDVPMDTVTIKSITRKTPMAPVKAATEVKPVPAIEKKAKAKSPKKK